MAGFIGIPPLDKVIACHLKQVLTDRWTTQIHSASTAHCWQRHKNCGNRNLRFL